MQSCLTPSTRCLRTFVDIRNIWMLSLLQMFPIVEGFPVAERIQEEKVSQIGQTDIFWKQLKHCFKTEQVADIDVLPESDPVMSDRMRGRERLLRADDASVAVRLPKVDVPASSNVAGHPEDRPWPREGDGGEDHWQCWHWECEGGRHIRKAAQEYNF